MKLRFPLKKLLIIPLVLIASFILLRPALAKTLLLDKYGNLSVINNEGSVLSIIAEKNESESSKETVEVKSPLESNPEVKELESLAKEIEKKAEKAKKELESDSQIEESLKELNDDDDVFEIHDNKERTGVFKLESSNGRVKVESHMEGEESSESAEVEKVEVEESNEFKKIKIKTSGLELEIESQGVKALTSLPVNLDTSNNSLSITTSKNKSIIKILPAQVIQNLISQKVFDLILDIPNLPAPKISTGSATKNDAAKVEIEEKNGEVVYKIRGTKTYKFLNLVPVDFNIETEVSPETGAVKNVTEPLVLQILGLLFIK